jgi:hypothetical protein
MGFLLMAERQTGSARNQERYKLGSLCYACDVCISNAKRLRSAITHARKKVVALYSTLLRPNRECSMQTNERQDVGRSVAETDTKLSDASAFALSPTTPLSPCAFFKPPETSLLRLRAASSLINTDFLNATHPDQVPSPCEQQRTTVCIAQTLSQPSHLQSCASRAT